jgi:heme/copper-type cytochrome/quinol oxidase subunit 4
MDDNDKEQGFGTFKVWDKHAKIALTLFILGFFFPPLWFALCYYRNSRNDYAYLWYQVCTYIITIVVVLLYCTAWLAAVILMNYDANSCIIANGRSGCCFFYNLVPNCNNFVYYNQIKPPATASNPSSYFYPEPGEYIAMIFTPLITIIILWEVIIWIKNTNWKAYYNSMKIKVAAKGSSAGSE